MATSDARHSDVFPQVDNQIKVNSEAGGEWARQGSNLRPTTYEEAALTTELRARRDAG